MCLVVERKTVKIYQRTDVRWKEKLFLSDHMVASLSIATTIILMRKTEMELLQPVGFERTTPFMKHELDGFRLRATTQLVPWMPPTNLALAFTPRFIYKFVSFTKQRDQILTTLRSIFLHHKSTVKLGFALGSAFAPSGVPKAWGTPKTCWSPNLCASTTATLVLPTLAIFSESDALRFHIDCCRSLLRVCEGVIAVASTTRISLSRQNLPAYKFITNFLVFWNSRLANLN